MCLAVGGGTVMVSFKNLKDSTCMPRMHDGGRREP